VLGFDDANCSAFLHQCDLLGGLIDQLVSVSNDESPAAPAGEPVGKEDGFTQASSPGEERTPAAALDEGF